MAMKDIVLTLVAIFLLKNSSSQPIDAQVFSLEQRVGNIDALVKEARDELIKLGIKLHDCCGSDEEEKEVFDDNFIDFQAKDFEEDKQRLKNITNYINEVNCQDAKKLQRPIFAKLISPDRYAVAYNRGFIQIFELHRDDKVFPVTMHKNVGIFMEHSISVTHFIGRSDGLVISGDNEGKVLVWSSKDFSIKYILDGHQGSVEKILSFNKGKVLTGSSLGKIYVFQMKFKSDPKMKTCSRGRLRNLEENTKFTFGKKDNPSSIGESKLIFTLTSKTTSGKVVGMYKVDTENVIVTYSDGAILLWNFIEFKEITYNMSKMGIKDSVKVLDGVLILASGNGFQIWTYTKSKIEFVSHHVVMRENIRSIGIANKSTIILNGETSVVFYDWVSLYEVKTIKLADDKNNSSHVQWTTKLTERDYLISNNCSTGEGEVKENEDSKIWALNHFKY